jgi:hypothetical protein
MIRRNSRRSAEIPGNPQEFSTTGRVLPTIRRNSRRSAEILDDRESSPDDSQEFPTTGKALPTIRRDSRCLGKFSR